MRRGMFFVVFAVLGLFLAVATPGQQPTEQQMPMMGGMGGMMGQGMMDTV